METLKTLILRIVAVFGSSALAAVAGGAVLDVELWKAAAIAGIVASAKVTESLLRAWSQKTTGNRQLSPPQTQHIQQYDRNRQRT